MTLQNTAVGSSDESRDLMNYTKIRPQTILDTT
jgi:hypothetical protein